MAEPLNRTLSRGLDILTLLSNSRAGMELHEIARTLDIPRSSTHNLLHTLHDMSYIDYHAATSRYTLSMKLFEVGARAVRHTDIDAVIREQLRVIYAALNETVHCGIPDHQDVVYIDRIESSHSIRMTARIGFRIPLYCTAMGRAILACMDDTAVRALLQTQTFTPLTAYTITGIDALLDALAVVRKEGVAFESQESNENVCCMGVAICDSSGTARYAISVSTPIFRMTDEERGKCRSLLLHAKAVIERYLSAAI